MNGSYLNGFRQPDGSFVASQPKPVPTMAELEAENIALKERVQVQHERIRVLEEECLTNLIHALIGVGNHTDASDMARIGLRAISCYKAGFAKLTHPVAGGYAEIIANAITGRKGVE